VNLGAPRRKRKERALWGSTGRKSFLLQEHSNGRGSTTLAWFDRSCATRRFPCGSFIRRTCPGPSRWSEFSPKTSKVIDFNLLIYKIKMRIN
jgi:hypothetical protein